MWSHKTFFSKKPPAGLSALNVAAFRVTCRTNLPPKMKEYYEAHITNATGHPLPRIYVRKYVNASNEDVYGFGMTRKHRSCLVVRIQETGKTAVVEGLSMFCKKTGLRKNPLRLQKDHMRTWLSVADAFALFMGIKKLTLFDAANVLFPDGTFAFLSHCTLLRDGTFLYTKYGYLPSNPFVHDAVLSSLQRSPKTFAQKTDNSLVGKIFEESSTWSEVYTAIGHCPDKYELLPAVFAALGIKTISELQMYYAKRISDRTCSSFKVSLSVIQPPSWLVSYSDRWMDIY